MARRRENNGIAPGKTVKNINNVALSDRDWERFRRARDKYDATAGWLVAQALHSWMNWKKL